MMTSLAIHSNYRRFLLPICLILAFTPWSGPFDLFLSQLFFREGHFMSSPVFDFIYHYALLPAWLVVAAAVGALLLRRWQREALFLILTLAIGSGLIIHLCLKDHWGRPRPRQVIEYGGQQLFRPYYQPNFNPPEKSKSFPCGHCSMGFYFFAIALVGKHLRKKSLYYAGWILAWGLGGTLGFVRMAQGGHFFSDVIFSGLIMWATAWVLSYFLLEKAKP